MKDDRLRDCLENLIITMLCLLGTGILLIVIFLLIPVYTIKLIIILVNNAGNFLIKR